MLHPKKNDTNTDTNKAKSPVRLGYACINLTLRDGSRKVNTNRTCRLATALKAGEQTGQPPGSPAYSNAIYEFLTDYGRRNTAAIVEVLQWHVETGLRFYRLSSDIFPHIDNDRFIGHMTEEDIERYRRLDAFTENIQTMAELAYQHDIRVTMHPSPYAVLGSPDQEKVMGTIDTLKWHARIYVIMEEYIQQRYGVERAFKDSILCLHVGGKYPKHGGKPATLERWKQNYRALLPEWVQRHVAIENCEKNFCVEDLLPFARELGIPIIFDFHHYDCYPDFHQGEAPQRSKAELLPEIIATWSARGMRPKFHLSDQDPDKSRGAHAQFVARIPDELLQLHQKQPEFKFDLMIEAKAKDYSVFYLLDKYPEFNDTNMQSPIDKIPNSFLNFLPGSETEKVSEGHGIVQHLRNISLNLPILTKKAGIRRPSLPLPRLRNRDLLK